jgi:GDPmannose 4,6-dehydratase
MRALITGAAGQDGTILCSMLNGSGYHVIGVVKPGTHTGLVQRYAPGIELVEADLADADMLHRLVDDLRPDEIYNLGGFSAPGESWAHQDEVRRINVDAVAAMLAGMRSGNALGRFFQASSASIFEGVDRSPQTEAFEPHPRSPYAISKLDAMTLVRQAREQGLFAVSGIMYNHESPLRGENFVTRRVSMGVARIASGLQERLELGDIEVARDWGWAPDYVRGMRLMLKADRPRDFLLATGISHRLSFFISRAFLAVGISDWGPLVVSTSDRARPVDTNLLVGDSRAAQVELGWRHTVAFDDIATAMVRHDQALLADPEALWPCPA